MLAQTGKKRRDNQGLTFNKQEKSADAHDKQKPQVESMITTS